jgi:hypothetical protein
LSTYTHKQLAATCFNATWDLLDLKERTHEEEERMIHLAHASFWHWTQVEGHTPKNLSIGYWQLSRVYAVAGLGERANYYGERCLEVSLENQIEPFYIGYAYEAMGRANALLKRDELVKGHIGLGLEYAEQVKDDNSKNMLINDLHTIL